MELKTHSLYRERGANIAIDASLKCRVEKRPFAKSSIEESIICEYYIDNTKYAELNFGGAVPEIVGFEGCFGEIEGAHANLGGRCTTLSIELLHRLPPLWDS
ncbi:MAG: hypothetical protein QXH03_07630 [Candidatus Bathyarchaeia archaeon]